MHRLTATLLRCCLAGSALATSALLSAPAQAAVYTQSDVEGTAAAAMPVSFEVYLPLRNIDQLEALLSRQQDKASSDYHKFLTPAQFGAQFGPAKATIDAAAAELRAQGFNVIAQTRSLHVTGTAAAVTAAFHAPLSMVRGAGRPVALGGLTLSPTLTAAGAKILSFAPQKPMMHTLSQRIASAVPADRYGPGKLFYWYDDQKQAYGYPAVNAMVTAHDGAKRPLDGSGVTLGALMSSDMLDSDIAAVFAHENYAANAGRQAPTLYARRYIAGAVPGNLTDAFAEASIDTQEEIGGAPGAQVILYDIPDLNDDSITAGYVQIDELNEADVVSSSFGGCELFYTAAYNDFGGGGPGILQTYHELFMQGNAQGITFLASSGDEAGRECPSVSYVTGGTRPTFIPSVSTPASDTDVTAVGGTNLVTVSTVGSLNSAYLKENAYGDPEYAYDPYGLGTKVLGGYWGAGGGVSQVFSKPSYQSAIVPGVSGRLVPDVGMQVGGCPGLAKFPCNGGDRPIEGNGNDQRSAGVFSIEGGFYLYIGTSLSSPEFASALALLVEQQGRQGNVNPYLYQMAAAQKAGSAAPAYHRGIPGFNGVVPDSVPGMDYNYTTGNGTPYVATLMGVPPGTPLAGLPQTPSNP